MTVQLIGTFRNYVGLSGDQKPVTQVGSVIPNGSTFTETDTGRKFVWDAYRWNLVSDGMDRVIVDRLEQIIEELRELKEIHQAVIGSL